MLTSLARRLVKALEPVGAGRTTSLGMTDPEIQQALADLERIVDDDGRHVPLVVTTPAGGGEQLELTAPGRAVARMLS